MLDGLHHWPRVHYATQVGWQGSRQLVSLCPQLLHLSLRVELLTRGLQCVMCPSRGRDGMLR